MERNDRDSGQRTHPAQDTAPSEDQLAAANAELANQGRGGVSARAARPAVIARGRSSVSSQRDGTGWITTLDGPVPQGLAAKSLSSDVLDQLRLSSIPGVGPRIMAALLDRFGSAAAVFQAGSDSLRSVSGVGSKLFQQIKLECRNYDLDEMVHWCNQHATEILTRGQAAYPQMLLDLEDAPPILFCRGEIHQQDELAVAIVGTRHATPYGLQQAERLGYSLARAGVTIVSGLARGIDAAAHEGAIAAGGRTIAVLGGGLAQMYPREHEGLAKAISADGAVISEHPPMTKTRAGLFPQRNRIVAGLSLATLVVEAPEKSGSLITARLAAEQNRDVMALPGPVTSRASQGCNRLIRDGAILVRNADDILEQIGPIGRPISVDKDSEVRNPVELQLNEIEQRVLRAISPMGTPIDEVITSSQLPSHRVIAILSVLEMRRLVRRLPGQCVSRN